MGIFYNRCYSEQKKNRVNTLRMIFHMNVFVWRYQIDISTNITRLWHGKLIEHSIIWTELEKIRR